jgi:hypothetical protein
MVESDMRLSNPALAVCVLSVLTTAHGGVFTDIIGVWPTASPSWQGANTDVADSANAFDIVGNSSYPALQYALDGNYIYFRMQINSSDIGSSPNGSYLIYVDRVGWTSSGNPGTPDFAFAWDAKSNDKTKHGLEMTRYGSGTTWGTLGMDDIDNDPSVKGAADINGSLRNGDGMVRVETGANGTTGAGRNSYVEFAIAWDYLRNNSTTGLDQSQIWNIGASAIFGATDHASPSPNGDVLGAAYMDSIFSGSGSGWGLSVSTVPVPEAPASPGLLLSFLGAVGLVSKRRSLAEFLRRVWTGLLS